MLGIVQCSIILFLQIQLGIVSKPSSHNVIVSILNMTLHDMV